MRFETLTLGVPGPPGPASIVPGPTGPEGPQGIPGPPGGESGSVNGVAALRALPVVVGQTLQLNYHTTPGDLGAGLFVGTTTGGPYADDGGTIIVGADASKAWLRVWDQVKAHVGWFGAKCQPALPTGPDDYLAVKRCFDLFTNGRTSLRSGVVDVGPGFNFSQPLIYGGSLGQSFKLMGSTSNARGGQEPSLLRYTGPRTDGSIIIYGANQWVLEDINTFPGNALNAVMVISDNTYNNPEAGGVHTTTHAITAGADVVVTPSGATAAIKTFYLQPGCYLGVDAGGPNFEIVYLTKVDTVVGTFTATFKKNHASGVLLGGGTASSGGRVNRCYLLCPQAPVYTTLTADAPGLLNVKTIKTIVVADITNVTVGQPLRIGYGLYAEIVYPTSVNVGAKSFVAESIFSHATGERVMYPTAAIYIGNRLLGTVQVSEIAMYDTHLQGDGAYMIDGYNQTRCYAGVRQVWGGNVKNFTFHTMYAASIKVPFAFEQPSGQYLISGGVSGGIEDTLIYAPGATITVEGWEDESACIWLVGHSTGGHANFIGCTMQGQVPYPELIPGAPPATLDEIFYFGGQLTFIGCSLLNARIYGTTLPIIVCNGIRADDIFPGSATLINCEIVGASPTSMNFVRDQPGGTLDVIKDGTGKFTMLNCNGRGTGNPVRLPNVLPPLNMWQGTATYDPVSLAAGTVGTAQTMTVSGAALGDLVEASFSLDLQGAVLRAWVSAADTVKYQFSNPAGGSTVDLGSGTVKCRVKK